MNFFLGLYTRIFSKITLKKFSKWPILNQMKILNPACEGMYVHYKFFFFEICIRKSFEMAKTKPRKILNFGIEEKFLIGIKTKILCLNFSCK